MKNLSSFSYTNSIACPSKDCTTQTTQLMNEEALIAVDETRVIWVNITTFTSTEEAASYYAALVELFV